MIKTIILTVLYLIIFGCKTLYLAQELNKNHIYPTVSYLDIKLDSAGNLPYNPYILKFENGPKK